MLEETNDIHIRPLGDSALTVILDEKVNKEVHEKVLSLISIIEKNPFIGFLEALPAYNKVTIFYNPIEVYQTYVKQNSIFETVSMIVKNYVKKITNQVNIEHRCVDIPVLYGGQYGPDLEHVAKINHLTPEEVIHIHTKNEYLVYMIGFAPGFPFLGGMDQRIAAPRKDSPRSKIPSGSVGIAGEQTGIYPLETPGGWQIIGRTPLDLFLPASSSTLLKPGDTLRFVAISHEEYLERKEEVKQCLST